MTWNVKRYIVTMTESLIKISSDSLSLAVKINLHFQNLQQRLDVLIQIFFIEIALELWDRLDKKDGKTDETMSCQPDVHNTLVLYKVNIFNLMFFSTIDNC